MCAKKSFDHKRLATAAIVIAAAIAVVGMILLVKGAHDKSVKKIIKPKPVIGLITIIIDDWGYNANVLSFLETIKAPFAAAVLPKLPYSKILAQIANANGKEVMLHLPLEPHKTSERYPKDYIITSSMNAKKVQKLIDECLVTVPFAQGVNNHMGSKATETKTFMKTIFGYLKTKKFFFVDSYVTEKSICASLAESMDFPIIKRDVFFDNVMTRAAIEYQFDRLAKLARTRGYAVGIGHARTLTLQILQEQSKALTEQGFQFVTVKDMIRYQQTLGER
jgi:polysaccharide deacetylase 2 family uncharacterized protein YibQ